MEGGCLPLREKKKRGIVGGKQKIKKSTNAEKNGLKKKQRPHNTLPNMVPNGHYALRLHELCEPMHVCTRPLTPKQTEFCNISLATMDVGGVSLFSTLL